MLIIHSLFLTFFMFFCCFVTYKCTFQLELFIEPHRSLTLSISPPDGYPLIRMRIAHCLAFQIYNDDMQLSLLLDCVDLFMDLLQILYTVAIIYSIIPLGRATVVILYFIQVCHYDDIAISNENTISKCDSRKLIMFIYIIMFICIRKRG